MDGVRGLQEALLFVAMGLGFHRPPDQPCNLELGNFVRTGPQPVSLEEEKGSVQRLGCPIRHQAT